MPQRVLPIGIMGSLLICIALYVGVSLVITRMIPYYLLSDEAPLAAAFTAKGPEDVDTASSLPLFLRPGGPLFISPDLDFSDQTSASFFTDASSDLVFNVFSLDPGGKIRSKLVAGLADAEGVVIVEGTAGVAGKAAALQGIRNKRILQRWTQSHQPCKSEGEEEIQSRPMKNAESIVQITLLHKIKRKIDPSYREVEERTEKVSRLGSVYMEMSLKNELHVLVKLLTPILPRSIF